MTTPQAPELRRVIDVMTPEYVEQYRLLPVGLENGSVVIAHAGPVDVQAFAELTQIAGVPLSLREVAEDQLQSWARRTRFSGSVDEVPTLADREELLAIDDDAIEAHDLAELANQAPVIRLVNVLLADAVTLGASDIHLEASTRGLTMRYRVEGVLQAAPSPPPTLRAAIISRIKIMADLDVAERRLPQDGRVRLRVEGRDVDVRISTLPTLRGESVVIRLLDPHGAHADLATLGMAEDTLASLVRFTARTHGMLLVTGPTGSGKTTTLYALLARMLTGREKVVTVEDPVEYELAGVTQVPVHSRVGLTFARALRSILRQDPDVLLVGEMRDAETAEICTQASLTGHLVLSTLHTNDAPGALTRLLDLGVADYLVASTVEMVLAQRLLRCVCDSCAVTVALEPSLIAEARENGCELETVRRGAGCVVCRGTGYRGRTGIYELLVVDEHIRDAFLERRGTSPIRKVALDGGMRSLRADGWRLVGAGVTTPEEVLRVMSN